MNKKSPRHLPQVVWALGFVSLFMDVSSEMIHSLLPVFLVSVLGASATALGVLEGVAEATVLFTRLLSGALSDWFGRRKPLALAGYGLASLTKPAFPLAGSYAVVFGARLVDRFGKGVRGAPRDALVADSVPAHLRGTAYGLRQSLDTLGALIGPLLAFGLMLASSGDFRFVFWMAVPPGLASVLVLALFVREPGLSRPKSTAQARIGSDWLRDFGKRFWLTVAVGAAFTLARFSEGFLLLRSDEVGLPSAYVPLVLGAMNLTYAVSAYPAGRLSDRMPKKGVLAVGAAVLVAADLVLAVSKAIGGLFIGVLLWGLHMGFSQGILAALVADAAPVERRGTAFGLFSLAAGIAVLLSSVWAGFVWDRFGSPSAFYAGACLAGAALVGLLALRSEPFVAPDSPES